MISFRLIWTFHRKLLMLNEFSFMVIILWTPKVHLCSSLEQWQGTTEHPFRWITAWHRIALYPPTPVLYFDQLSGTWAMHILKLVKILYSPFSVVFLLLAFFLNSDWVCAQIYVCSEVGAFTKTEQKSLNTSSGWFTKSSTYLNVIDTESTPPIISFLSLDFCPHTDSLTFTE